MKVENIHLAGVGTYLPKAVPTKEAVAAGWYDADECEASGIESVLVEDSVSAPDMAIRAAETALRRSGHEPDDFAALVHTNAYHQGPDGWSAPHYVLLNTLGRTIPAVEVRQGCLGMLASLEAAAGRLIADPSSKDAVLLTTGDNYSTPKVNRWTASKLFLLADAGSSLVVSRRSGFARVLAVGSLSDPRMEALHRGAEQLLPPSITAGLPLDFESRIQYWRKQWASGVKPPIGHFGDQVAAIADRTLAEAGVTMEQIRRVCHVGFNDDPLQTMFLEPLGVEDDRSIWEHSRRIGHTGVSDFVIGLERLWLDGEVEPGDHVMLVGAATGMEAGCAVLEITAAPGPQTAAA
ncbi:putative 3-Oxoacyl-[acyl-carrier-protein (ACP)] synthase III [Actinacidiphila reveromycinica]|uniref:Putative 3-Oxoacyl-[acyl-carrier-protein (ACP)] synthase III n=1 Tax=Actinacidiphila reveromycinica TaxID=659352 RepID=A0A7U3UWL8_9ACTN|nr:ketoacyl-ACP synthase III family protein [Streptomyces sp. SN-593]BBB00122.1 putative 3-Oxoacyl-[acyl-carrier-protein (ACP)] synthase III [Streptomyces sp. SN-593]